jgi:hypothetical protein
MGASLYMLFLYFGAPIGIAKLFVGGSWPQIGLAYAIWFGALSSWAGIGLLQGIRTAEAIGWAFLMGMFLTIPAVTILTIVIRIVRTTAEALG